MATCKDCLHDNACTAIFKYYGGNPDCNVQNVEVLCRQFRAKSDYQKIRRGKWIMQPHAFGFLSPNCSACHQFNKYHEQTDFCPKCGAIMEHEKANNSPATTPSNPLDVLNHYRNCHYNAPSGTEEHQLANAINDILPLVSRLQQEKPICPMRDPTGRCIPHGGLCAAVSEEICSSLNNAYNHGYADYQTNEVSHE